MRACIFILLMLLSAEIYAQQYPPGQLHDSLKEVTIRSQAVKRVLHAAKEYVVDYDFVGDHILVASYTAPNYRDPKLFLLDKQGDTSFLLRMPDVPEALYQSCVGKHYCIGDNGLYPLTVSTGDIEVNDPYDLGILPALKECQYATPKRFYFKYSDRENFKTSYSYQSPGAEKDTVFLVLEDAQTASSSQWEYQRILELLSFGDFSGAAKLAGTRHLLNKGAYAFIDMPLFEKNDSLVVFDFRKKMIRYFDMTGMPLKNVVINFDWKNVQRLEILKDRASGQFYLHSYPNNIAHSLSQINMETGYVNFTIPIEKTFPSNLKVYNNEIYFLWQNPAEPTTQQLYVQKGF